jgi:hypothetical protein
MKKGFFEVKRKKNENKSTKFVLSLAEERKGVFEGKIDPLA